MCLIIFDWQPDQANCLTLASNRDEFYARASQQAHFWEDSTHIFGGRDGEMHGTWLAVSTTGRLAAVTNYRAPDDNTYSNSRGEIPVNFLNSRESTESFVEQLKQIPYAGYNALLFDGLSLVYTSNRSAQQTALSLIPGRYGLSNHLLDTPWPKVKRAKAAFEQAIRIQNHVRKINGLFDAMADSTSAPDDELPVTGIPVEFERMVSPVFIKSPSYGTRTTTIMTVSKGYKNESGKKDGQFGFYERNFQPDSNEFEENRYDIDFFTN